MDRDHDPHGPLLQNLAASSRSRRDAATFSARLSFTLHRGAEVAVVDLSGDDGVTRIGSWWFFGVVIRVPASRS